MSWTLTALLTDLSSWSDRDGHDAADSYDDYDDPEDPNDGEDALDHEALFTEILGEVREIGLSFGGGSLYANGVGVLGSESVVTFELESYTIS